MPASHGAHQQEVGAAAAEGTSDAVAGTRAGPGSRLMVPTLLLASTLTIMSAATISPALPAMELAFSDVDNAQLLVRLVLTVTALAIAISAPVAGILADRIGRKPILATSILLYGFAGGSGLVLDNVYHLLISRIALGIAVGGVMTSATALIADLYVGRDRSRVLGLQAAFMGIGGVVFLSLGGLLAELGWRGPFAIYLAALPLAVLVIRTVTEPRHAGPPLGGTEMAPDQRRGSALSLLLGILALAFAAQVAFYAIPTQLPFFLEELSGIGSAGTGFAIAGMVSVQALVGFNFHRINVLLGNRSLAAASFSLMAVGMIALGSAPGLPVALLALLVAGVGVGLVMPTFTGWLSEGRPPATRGRAMGVMVSLMFFGQFLSPVLAHPIISRSGISAVFIAAGVLAATVSVAVISIRPTRRVTRT